MPDAKSRHWTCAVDIAILDAVQVWIEQTVAKFGKLYGYANVAGKLAGLRAFVVRLLTCSCSCGTTRDFSNYGPPILAALRKP